MKQKSLFQEKQKFTQWWLWAILIASNSLFFYVVFTQEIGVESTQEKLPIYFVVLLLLPIFSLGLFYLLNLKTEITHNKIYFKFFPFHLKEQEYLLSDIQQMEVVKYSPIGDYGGWGIRGFGNDKAFNVKGNMGLKIVFKDGKKRLIGTQKPKELQKIIKELGF